MRDRGCVPLPEPPPLPAPDSGHNPRHATSPWVLGRDNRRSARNSPAAVVCWDRRRGCERSETPREEHEHSLRPALANPLLKNEFDSLCSDEDERSKATVNTIKEFVFKVLDSAKEELLTINDQLNKVIKSLSLAMDNLVYVEDMEFVVELEKISDIQPHLFITLQRFEAFKSQDATRTDAKGRPFKETF